MRRLPRTGVMAVVRGAETLEGLGTPAPGPSALPYRSVRR
jgi:hypothetical protein